MVSFCLIGSGSDANAYYFSYQNRAVMIDNGFTLKELRARSLQLGISLDEVDALFITHTHGDHIKGVGAFARAYGIPVCHHHMADLSGYQAKRRQFTCIPIVPEQFHQTGAFTVRAFETSHDSSHSISYQIEVGGRRFLIITDTGVVSAQMHELAQTADVLFLEANYEPQMLFDGPYPPSLKQRIASSLGHLSNDDAIDFLNGIGREHKISQIYLTHLSGVNNDVDLLESRLVRQLVNRLPVEVCPKGGMASGRIPSRSQNNDNMVYPQ
jgi:phosphoribosyl 1,2-cyclic phosphodiesterase